jgi:hypothetical protein
MKLRGVLVIAALVAAGCSSLKPVPIAAGDVCFNCRRVINEPAMAAEMVEKSGLAFKFRTVGCMARYLKAHPEAQGVLYVTDNSTKRLIKASTAAFVPTVIVEGYKKTPDYIAFGTDKEAREAAAREKSEPRDWKAVLAEAE